MDEKIYTLNEIINNNKLIFNLKLDIIFKNVFLNINSLNYICLLLSKIYNISFDNLIKECVIINGEITNKNIEKKSSYTDLVLRYKNIDFIIEMNYREKDYTLEKNNSYLFNLHTSKIFNSNKYGKNIYTYLLNIDDYDILNKNDFIYKSNLNYYKYNVCLYKNIKITHLNLANLKDKLYNESEVKRFSDIEKLLLIFVSQRKDIVRRYCKSKEVEEVIKIMDKIKIDSKLPTYDYEEFLRQERIAFAKKNKALNKRYEKFEKDVEKYEKDVEKYEKDVKKYEEEKIKTNEEYNRKEKLFNKNLLEFNNEKIELAKQLIKIGFSKNEISKITKLSKEQLTLI